MALIASSIATPATAATSPADEAGLIPYDGPLPVGMEVKDGQDIQGQMPESMSDGVWALELAGHGSLVNTYEWDQESESLHIYTAHGDEAWGPLLERYFPNEKVDLIPAKHSRTQIDDVLAKIVADGGALPNGDRVVTAIPEKDGSYITVGVEGDNSANLMRADTLADVLASEVPLVVEEAPEVQEARRNHSYLDDFWFGGASMSTPGTTSGTFFACSTGFAIGHLTTGQRGMLSAEHCGRGKPGTNWYYGHTSGTGTARSLGDFQGELDPLNINPDAALWTGGNLNKMVPAIFTGAHNDVNTGEFIRGGNYPAVGTDVCYTGAPSGNVCRNEVLFQGLLICYAIGQCYGGLSWTSQRDSVEAAGNGDSGGPVYQMVSGKAMASGVISGIVGGSSTCTGEPGTASRSCSPVALFAPVVTGIATGGNWGLSYIP
ncbi:hypothetical protein ACI3KS_14040 [Microbacterium sp. ZW T5_45]|uniref:hypothetical protein n=1 Tax=Microbacterium sp. ZW T5_45 TaxID=3378080 RepID=UPI00385515EF